MFSYNKFLQYPVKICKPNPRLANVVITQYGGPNGELGASLRYLSQRYTMPDEVTKGLLTDIGNAEYDWRAIHKNPMCAAHGIFYTISESTIYQR